jgi:hypothetical protein
LLDTICGMSSLICRSQWTSKRQTQLSQSPLVPSERALLFRQAGPLRAKTQSSSSSREQLLGDYYTAGCDLQFKIVKQDIAMRKSLPERAWCGTGDRAGRSLCCPSTPLGAKCRAIPGWHPAPGPWRALFFAGCHSRGPSG